MDQEMLVLISHGRQSDELCYVIQSYRQQCNS